MGKGKKTDTRLVYSTDAGRLCPQCHRAVAECVCGDSRPAYTGDGIVRLHRESKGRGGKVVTVEPRFSGETLSCRSLPRASTA